MSGNDKKKTKVPVTGKGLKPVLVILPNGTVKSVPYKNHMGEREVLRVNTKFKIEKFIDHEALKRNEPYEVVDGKGNVMLDEFANFFWTMLCEGVGQIFDEAHARIGVGNGDAGEDPIQTGLQGASQLYKAMDATYPTYGSDREAVFRSTFEEDEANFHWEEWTVDNGAVDEININRKVVDLGIKPDTEIWRFTVTLSF